MDIKPANIMLTPEGNVCLIDFNISLAGESEEINGISESYASPEQYRKWWGTLYGTADKDIVLDAATDIYSLAATFYHMMTGYLPSPDAMKMQPITRFALPYSSALVQIIDKMLIADSRKRYQSAAKVKMAIRQLQRTKAEKNTLKAVFGLMSAAFLVLVAVFGITLFRSRIYVGKEAIAVIQEKELQLTELCNSGDYQTAYREGITFLNTESDNLDKLKGARQSILEKMVDICIGMKDYNTASYHLDELFEIEEKNEYYQSAAIIAAYKGEYEEAEKALEKAEEAGGSQGELQRCRAEMKAAQGLYGEALMLYQEIYAGNRDIVTLRRMASLALYAANEVSALEDTTDYAAYLTKAITYYEQLLNSGMASYSDRMNLATAYTMSGLNEKAITVLQGMSVDYPNQYAVFLQLGILKYNAEMKKSPSARDFSKVREYAGAAERLYKEMKIQQADEQLNSFLEIVSQIPE